MLISFSAGWSSGYKLLQSQLQAKKVTSSREKVITVCFYSNIYMVISKNINEKCQ